MYPFTQPIIKPLAQQKLSAVTDCVTAKMKLVFSNLLLDVDLKNERRPESMSDIDVSNV